MAASPVSWSAARWLFENESGIAALVAEETLHPGRWLDIGCGTGGLADVISHPRYLGVDSDVRRIAAARIRHPRHAFVFADATRGLAEFGRFSGALLVHVLHHLDDDAVRKLMNALGPVLLPDAHIVVIDPVPAVPASGLTHRILLGLETGRNHRTPERTAELLGLSECRIGTGIGSQFYRGFSLCGRHRPMR